MRSRMLYGFLASGLLFVALSMPGCEVPNPAYCEKNGDCQAGRVCDVVHAICVSPDAAVGSPDGTGGQAGATDLGADLIGPIDAELPVDGEPPVDGGAGSPVDASVVDAAVDTSVPDAAGTCVVNGDCTDPTKEFCVAGVCVGCQSAGVNACVAPTLTCDLTSGKCVGCTADSQCTVDPAKGFCVAGSCIGCNASGATGCAARTDGKTTCSTAGTTAGQCVACVADAQCTADPTKGFCVANVCTGCNTTGATGCSTRTDGKIVCATTGTSAGQCVSCVTDAQCTADPTKGFCVANACTGCNAAGATGCAGHTDGKTTCATTGTVAGQCVACVADAQCTADPAKGFCVANVCTGCNTTGASGCAARSDSKTTCATTGTAAGQCVVCVADTQCSTDPTKSFCVANACTGCNTTGATGCSSRADGKIVCATTGTAAGECVECATDGQCTANPSKGFCVANACTGCNAADASGCAGHTDGKTTCATTGTAAGQCVECTTDSQCTANPAKGFCVANACTGCNTTGATGCAGRTDGKTVCAATGTVAGQCVVCVASSDCKVATAPICTSNTCGACTADSQCSAKLGATGNPGVCLNNIDGHCATDSETVYVQNVVGTCAESGTGAGSAATPFCAARNGVNAAVATTGKDLVMMTGALADFSIAVPSKILTVVGKSAVITPAAFADGIDITSGTVYLRNITIQGATSTGMGISAAPTSGNSVTLYLSGCKVTNNPGGGILLNGAAFDIENTTVTGNGPGTFSGLPWGGVLIQNIPASGPTTLNLVTVQNNNPVGISCSATITGTGILATGNNNSTNAAYQISGCGFTSCTAASTGCGAQ